MSTRDRRRSDKGEEPTRWELSIYELHCDGRSYRDIAAECNCSSQTVMRVVHEVSEWYRPQMAELRKRTLVVQYRRLEHIFCESMDTYRRSFGEAVETSETVGGENGPSTTTKTKHLAGDHGALRTAMAALDAQRQLLGLIDERENNTLGRIAGRPATEVIDERMEELRKARDFYCKPSSN